MDFQSLSLEAEELLLTNIEQIVEREKKIDIKELPFGGASELIGKVCKLNK